MSADGQRFDQFQLSIKMYPDTLGCVSHPGSIALWACPYYDNGRSARDQKNVVPPETELYHYHFLSHFTGQGKSHD